MTEPCHYCSLPVTDPWPADCPSQYHAAMYWWEQDERARRIYDAIGCCGQCDLVARQGRCMVYPGFRCNNLAENAKRFDLEAYGELMKEVEALCPS